MDTTNVKAEFTIYADRLSHGEITDALGIMPDYLRYWNEELNNGRRFGHDEWGIETKYENSFDILNQLNKLIGALKNKADIINKICVKYSAKCSFVVVVRVENGTFPAIGLDTDFLRFAASINADFCVDPYCFS